MKDFLDEPAQKHLYFWCDFKNIEDAELFVANTRPPNFFDEDIKGENYNVVCFIKKNDVDQISLDGLRDSIQFLTINKEPLDDLLEKMQTNYIKTLLAENEWPDTVKKEFVAGVHKFMAFLNEHTHKARGQTYLYIPQEDLNDPQANSKDRDLIQRLESTIIGWTGQIKELVSSQDSPNSKAVESPLDEINYW
jgi:dynein heavy chain